jgi:cytochrome c
VQADFNSDELKAKVAASKFNEWPTFGKTRRGYIGLQDHGDTVWYRNIKIRERR